MTITRKWN